MSQSTGRIEDLYHECLKESQILRATMYELAKANPARERTDAPHALDIGVGIKEIGEKLIEIGNSLIDFGGE